MRWWGVGGVWGGWWVIWPPWSPSPHTTMHGWSRSLLFNIITAQIDGFISSFQKIKVFNEDIQKLIEGEEIVMETESRLCNKIREEFTSWVLILTTNIEKGKSWDRAAPKAASRLPRRSYFWHIKIVWRADCAHTRDLLVSVTASQPFLCSMAFANSIVDHSTNCLLASVFWGSAVSLTLSLSSSLPPVQDQKGLCFDNKLLTSSGRVPTSICSSPKANRVCACMVL